MAKLGPCFKKWASNTLPKNFVCPSFHLDLIPMYGLLYLRPVSALCGLSNYISFSLYIFVVDLFFPTNPYFILLSATIFFSDTPILRMQLRRGKILFALKNFKTKNNIFRESTKQLPLPTAARWRALIFLLT